MKILLTILFGANLLISHGQAINNFIYQNTMTAVQIETAPEHLIFKGKLVEVYVEKAIFHSPDNINFLMKFSIKNISEKTIGLDLSDYWKVFYPNQWGFYKEPLRQEVNERKIVPDKTINKTELIMKFKENSLAMIKPKETIEYYRDWNGSGEKVEQKNKEEYLIISIDGQLFLTDGMEAEHLTLNEASEEKRTVVIHNPITYNPVPEKSLIIKKK